MIDFRYHIVSIVAIFFALGAGVVLGAGPLKGTGSDIILNQANVDRASLVAARDEITQLKALNKYHQDYEAKVTAGLANGKLTNVKVALVVMPNADSDVVDGLDDELQKSGAQVTVRAALNAKLFDPGQRQLIEPLITQLATADVDFPKDSTTYERAGLILARGVAAKEPNRTVDTDATRILQGMSSSELVSLKPATIKDRATLIVVVAGKPATPAVASSTYTDAVDFIEGLDTGSAGVVLAGTPDTAKDGGLLKALRSDSDATKIVSSVDVADLPAGQMTVVFALVEQLTGKAGQYGAFDAKDGIAPAAVMPKDN
ncbi:copper transporter [Kribbella antibiotica]|uniref:Copper transporter n=1 Tax=Kribbella antibiotica TaxID=190195 RepID=A0A4R4ZGC0_9ACTN|nr:copper transporter [Kribbella antibiotica]TDD57096.1 copper transporter [Kribbella antibiotica]